LRNVKFQNHNENADRHLIASALRWRPFYTPGDFTVTKKPLFSLENSGFCGGRYRTRTCDPLHVKRQGYFFLIISAYF
ncbi:hypothetical protein, partial [Pseudoflavonifractor sp. An187]|uniref:hypothetical protein n=1 Tax=Pseudoflavonifractor sp. An187 TaxID=1965578 RepID=UPI00194FD1B4